MSSLNSCNFIGRCGSQPEVKYTADGKAVCNISIACNDVWYDKDKNKQEKTEWIKIVAFAKRAEVIGQYLKKGSLVYIGGKMQTTKYEKDGQTHYSTEIVCKDLKMLDTKANTQESAPQVTQVDNDGLDSESIPF